MVTATKLCKRDVVSKAKLPAYKTSVSPTIVLTDAALQNNKETFLYSKKEKSVNKNNFIPLRFTLGKKRKRTYNILPLLKKNVIKTHCDSEYHKTIPLRKTNNLQTANGEVKNFSCFIIYIHSLNYIKKRK